MVKHRKNDDMDLVLGPYKLLKAFHLVLGESAKLATKHLSIFQEFQDEDFVARRTPSRFNRLPPDPVNEQTINHYQKGPGGIIGSSTSQGSMQR